MQWSIGNGSTVDFWRDPWISNRSITSISQLDENRLPRESCSEYMDSERLDWDTGKLAMRSNNKTF